MYATVRRYEGVTDPAEATRRVNEGFIQIVSQIPGFVAIIGSTQGPLSWFRRASFRTSEESNKKAADYVRENLVSVLRNPPQIAAGKVVASKTK
jgi:hypothetical protein